MSVIPQRSPFVMVDQLMFCDTNRSCTTLTVREENVLFFDGELSEAGLAENIAQTAAAGVGYVALQSGEPVLAGYIGAIKNLEIFALPKAGDILETEVINEKKIFDVSVITGTVKCKGALLAKCEMKIFIENTTQSIQS